MSHVRETENRPEENGKDAKEEQAKQGTARGGKDGKSNGKNAGGGGDNDGFAAKRKDTAKKSVGRAMSRYAVWMNMHPMYSQPVILPQMPGGARKTRSFHARGGLFARFDRMRPPASRIIATKYSL